MKHRITDDVNVNLVVDFNAQDVSNTIDKIVEGAIKIIVVGTIAHILKSTIK